MIRTIAIRNFKSLVDVSIDLQKFNCFVGMNSAGKSTILQAIDFISQQMRGYLYLWLEDRGWESKDLYSRTSNTKAFSQPLFIEVIYDLDGKCLVWQGHFNRSLMRMTRESIHIDGEMYLEVIDGKYRTHERSYDSIPFEYSGSILGTLKDNVISSDVIHFRDALKNIRSLELLSPHLLRKRSRSEIKPSGVGIGGEKLSGYIDTLTHDDKKILQQILIKFYPQIAGLRTSTLKGGWKRLIIQERFVDANGDEAICETEAGQLNDGLLRILAVIAQLESKEGSLLLLDEIENGINPQVIELLVDALVNAKTQVIVTTHSPMILNYLEDDVARKGIQFVYKSPQGQTRVRPFFEIQRINEKLQVMGPGEAFIDTDLQRLARENIELDEMQQDLVKD
ncbi:AAA family ATPase [Klebsiella oxytoca]|uniref:AAA family ATPase n=1 Tax=Klebsiella oxytoca TaxID=571 RepID=UPI001CCB386C|nr:ATP-binding protein [Klebsiella oxytoca]HAV1912023.1 AAA family ATPase [Enterobacter hormaechei subsp. steigerwaltii]MBZ7254364.1 AAA family ATPase [Klebsiella oxytoca]MCE5368075.1 AAA family ATPase [Klebsiella oxytoca]HCT6327217.1 AAA family ATPase [Klebsiella oxytoca]HEC2050200.1 AAA family ATPase [Klebsiella oxytoca]